MFDSTITYSPPSSSLGRARLLLGGAGNVGSFLGIELARRIPPTIPAGAVFVRVVDRDFIEARNKTNQAYVDEKYVGRPKAEVLAEQMRAMNPAIAVEPVISDVEDVPVGLFADVEVCLDGFDSLRARQVLMSERAWPLGVPAIDGAVGGCIGSVKRLIPGSGCLECSWGPSHYRQLTREMPCNPLGSAQAPPTNSSAQLGQAVARIMVDELERFYDGPPPTESREITFDLVTGKRFESRLRKARRCRFDHLAVQETIRLGVPFAKATVGNLLAAVAQAWGTVDHVQFEFRRRIFEPDAGGDGRWQLAEGLSLHSQRRLADCHLTHLDRIRVKSVSRDAFLVWEEAANHGL